MPSLKILLINVLIAQSFCQVTRIVKRNALLSRQKRYLTFPMSSNFVITLSLIKGLLVVQPRGWNLAAEADIPFALPSDTRIFKGMKRSHHIQRREVMTGVEVALSKGGWNGTACVKRMACEARYFVETEGKSLIKDFFSVIFTSFEFDLNDRYGDVCVDSAFRDCEEPFFDYILGSFLDAK